MGDVAVLVLKLLVKATTIFAIVISFSLLFGTILSQIAGGLNSMVVGDLIAIASIWLPFNFTVILLWLLSASGLYLAYRLSVFIGDIVERFVGR